MKLPTLPKPSAVPSGDAIAADALQYQGHPYEYGAWDCSGFANHVLGQDLGLVLPGGLAGYKGPPPHGPVVLDYAGWGSAVPAGARGDLAIWPGAGPNGHMGFVVGTDQMISALDPATGTAITPITGFGPPGVQVQFRRVTGSAAGTPGGLIGTTGINLGAILAAPAVAFLVLAGMAAAIVAAAAVLGAGAVLVAEWAITKAAG